MFLVILPMGEEKKVWGKNIQLLNEYLFSIIALYLHYQTCPVDGISTEFYLLLRDCFLNIFDLHKNVCTNRELTRNALLLFVCDWAFVARTDLSFYFSTDRPILLSSPGLKRHRSFLFPNSFEGRSAMIAQ